MVLPRHIAPYAGARRADSIRGARAAFALSISLEEVSLDELFVGA
jgi:hypothetical protein